MNIDDKLRQNRERFGRKLEEVRADQDLTAQAKARRIAPVYEEAKAVDSQLRSERMEGLREKVRDTEREAFKAPAMRDADPAAAQMNYRHALDGVDGITDPNLLSRRLGSGHHHRRQGACEGRRVEGERPRGRRRREEVHGHGRGREPQMDGVVGGLRRSGARRTTRGKLRVWRRSHLGAGRAAGLRPGGFVSMTGGASQLGTAMARNGERSDRPPAFSEGTAADA